MNESALLQILVRGTTAHPRKHASQILPYRGIGSGIPRALKEWPRIELIDEVAGNQFSAVIWRPEAEWAGKQTITGEVTPEVTPEVARLPY